MQAAWGLSLTDPKADYAKVQEAWLKQLEEFVGKHKAGEHVAEALYQLAMANEYPPGDPEAAQKWYQRLVDRIRQQPERRQGPRRHPPADRRRQADDAQGRRRCNGGAVDLAQYRGRVVLIHYWSTVGADAQGRPRGAARPLREVRRPQVRSDRRQPRRRAGRSGRVSQGQNAARGSSSSSRAGSTAGWPTRWASSSCRR